MKVINFHGLMDATKSTKFKYVTAHALINHLKYQLFYANQFFHACLYRYHHTLKWLCLDRLVCVVTSLKNTLNAPNVPVQ